jgi:signal transduction histidine kinase
VIRTRTTGARIALILFAYAVAAVIGSTIVFFASRPVAESRIREAITREQQALAPLAARLPAAGLAAAITERGFAGTPGGAEYRLESPSGAPLAGRIPQGVVTHDAGPGYVRFELVPRGDARLPARHLLGAETRTAGGARLLIAYDVDAGVEDAQRVLRPVTLAVVLTALAGMVAALGYARRGEQQVRDASALVRRILAGDLSQRLPSWPGSVFSVVAQEFNVALDRIEQLTVAMRTVADSTAHDLRGPLNRLRAALEYALVGEADPVRLRTAIERSLGELERVEMTLEALLRIALAEAGTASLAPVDLSAVVADIVDLYRPLAEQKGQRLEVDLEPSLVLNGNGQLLAQAVANLVDNAIKYTPHGGLVAVRAAHERDGISLVVSDSGPGIAVEHRARALERSRRLPNSVGTPGSGLGLALVAAVMRLHGATIELDNGRPGLVVRLWLRRG